MTTNAIPHGGGTKAKADQQLSCSSSPLLTRNSVFQTLCCDKNCRANYQSVKLKDKSEAASPSLSQFSSIGVLVLNFDHNIVLIQQHWMFPLPSMPVNYSGLHTKS